MTLTHLHRNGHTLRPVAQAEHALQHLDTAVIIHDHDGLIVDCNDAAGVMLGVDRSNIIGRSLPDRHRGSDNDRCVRVDAELDPVAFTPGTRGRPIDIAVRRPAGELRWLRVSAGAMPTSDGLVVTTLSDVTDERSLARAHAISEEGHDVLLRSESIAELVDNMCAMLVRLDDHVLAWVALARDDPEHSVETVIAHGAVDYLYDGIVSWNPAEPRGRGPVGTALRDHIPALISDITADHSFAMWQPRAAAHGISSAVAIPFTMRGRNAALVVYARQPAAFNNRSLGVLARFGRDLEYGITNLTRHDQLRSALEATVQTIANINEVRDLYTSGHQRRVARLAAEIGRIIGLDEPALVALRLGALVHDVGKIAVPAEILSKPGPLHPCEIALVQRHADIGQQLLHTGALPDVVADIAGQHHERLNGSGYPQQLTGDDICIEARIVAVADVVEAIMHHRPYRPALGQQAALDTITAGAGTLFERDAVTACNTALNHGFTLDAPTSHDPHI